MTQRLSDTVHQGEVGGDATRDPWGLGTWIPHLQREGVLLISWGCRRALQSPVGGGTWSLLSRAPSR